MDDPLKVGAPRRSLVTEIDSAARPVTIAWHALRAWEDERSAHRRALRNVRESGNPAWIALADQMHGLQTLVERIAPALEAAGEEEALRALRLRVASMEQALAEGGVDVMRPENTEYTEELADYFEPVSQQVCDDAYEPVLLEVISPAVVLHGALIREGNAVVGVPSYLDEA